MEILRLHLASPHQVAIKFQSVHAVDLLDGMEIGRFGLMQVGNLSPRQTYLFGVPILGAGMRHSVSLLSCIQNK
jgi:hypothetical protein